jgi:hypothetical protein
MTALGFKAETNAIGARGCLWSFAACLPGALKTKTAVIATAVARAEATLARFAGRENLL